VKLRPKRSGIGVSLGVGRRRPVLRAALGPHLVLEELLGAGHVGLVEVLDDDGDVGVLLAQALEVEVVVQDPHPRRVERDGAHAAEGVRGQRVVVPDVGVLLARVLGARDVLGMGDLDLVGQRVEDLVQDLVHLVDVVVLEVVRGVHQEAEARVVDLREHPHRFLDRAHDVVHVGLQQEHRAVVVGLLRQLRDDLAAGLEPFLGPVLGVRHPFGFGVVGPRLGDDVGGAELPGVADDLLEPVDVLRPVAFVRVDDVGVARDGADRQVVVAEHVAHALGLVGRDVAVAQVDVLEVQVELDGVEPVAPDALGGLFQPIWEIAGENPGLKHDGVLPCVAFYWMLISSRRTVRFSAMER
jgi:hypothetical protein